MTTFLNIFKNTKKIIFFWTITYLFINLYYFLFLENLLEVKNFTNLNSFLLWLFLGLFYFIFIFIIIFYCIIISFFFEKFINEELDQTYENLEIIPIENNVRIIISFTSLKLIKSHPFINYYCDSLNLSLNLECKLQWINFGWKLFKTITDTLNDKQVIQDYLMYDSNFQHNNTLQLLTELKNLEKKNYQIQLFIKKKPNFGEFIEEDFYVIENQFDIDNIINELNNSNKTFYNNNNISSNNIYLKEDIIRFQLKLNIIEYLLFSSKTFQPIIEVDDKNV